MDERVRKWVDPHDLFAHERELVDAEEHHLLDEVGVPLLGLSLATLIAVFVGGALGTLARYVLAACHPAGAGSFPWVTLLVNLSGSLAIGLLVPVTEHVSHRSPSVRPLLMIGFLGGWTTYSTLAVDATLLLRQGDVLTCVAYLAATVGGGLALVVVGHAAGRRVAGA
jgi:CrcB protein